MMDRDILLIAFYNQKALGVKYIAEALKRTGYSPHILMFKAYNSTNPRAVSDTELKLLSQLIDRIKPGFIGLSVMSSLYLESIIKVHKHIKNVCDCPVIWGGVFGTLFPERCLAYADFVIRGEGEEAFAELLNTLETGGDFTDILNLAYKNSEGIAVVNPVRPLVQDLDCLGFPEIGGDNRYVISGNKLKSGDPLLQSLTYETTASRGCPFICSYCSSAALKRIYKGKGQFVRFRSVDSIIRELSIAKQKIRHLKLIHFWDEIFSNEEGWIESFADRYKKEVHIPFSIWGHPLKINEHMISCLVDAGLYHVVVGIQSGSVQVRREIFRRTESQDRIIESSRILSDCKVPIVSYDFMLQHPFETLQDLKDTFSICLDLKPPFELNLHGLNFLPGTDIVQMAVSKGLFSETEMENTMYGAMQNQYDLYWGSGHKTGGAGNVWMSLIYLTQFKRLRPFLCRLADRYEKSEGHRASMIFALKKICAKIMQIDRNIKKAKLLFAK
jgi:radical SAM superfamily enzyme YgiQ (UPF0313 family)